MNIVSFSQILGQERPKRFLKQVLSRQKMPHAYLFTGIPGVGKTSTAMALTMALNCRDAIDGDGCGRCPPCRQMIGRNFPDFLSIRPDGQNIKIRQIRDLNRELRFAPVLGRYRISVIHQAERMTTEAANSFLKTLEEPPPANILILNATEPLDLLPTIVSRCQKVPFQPLPIQGMTRWLVTEKGLDEAVATVLSRISSGSLGRAIKMSEGDFLEKRQQWLLRLTKLPGLSGEDVLEMALECAGEGKKSGLDGSEVGDVGIPDMLAVWETWYRDLLLVRVGGPSRLIINVDFSHKLQNIAGSYKIPDIIDSLLAIDQAQRDLLKKLNPALVLEHNVPTLNRLSG
jgi:DNA polymerase-3 subunit delta'